MIIIDSFDLQIQCEETDEYELQALVEEIA